METTRKALEELAVGGLVKASKKLKEVEGRVRMEPYVYTGLYGRRLPEPPGTWNGEIQKAMSQEMVKESVKLKALHPDTAELCKKWAKEFRKLGISLGIMMDAYGKGAPMQDWPYEDVNRLLEEMGYTSKMPDMPEGFVQKCRTWAIRLNYMNAWANALENLEASADRLGQSVKCSKDTQYIMKVLVDMHRKMAELSLKMPLYGDDHGWLVDMMWRFTLLEEILFGKEQGKACRKSRQAPVYIL